MTVSRPTWIQDKLPGVEFKNFEPISKFKLIVIDQFPSYNNALTADTFLKYNQNPDIKIFADSRILTPAHLVTPPDDIKLNAYLGNRLQYYIEALNSGDVTIPSTSILIESPLTSLAWLLFTKELEIGDKNKTDASIEFIKNTIFDFQSTTIHKINYSHHLLLQNQNTGNKTNEVRKKIFEGCLLTSAKIVTQYSQSKVEIIRN
jgi:hypothetical protein